MSNNVSLTIDKVEIETYYETPLLTEKILEDIF